MWARCQGSRVVFDGMRCLGGCGGGGCWGLFCGPIGVFVEISMGINQIVSYLWGRTLYLASTGGIRGLSGVISSGVSERIFNNQGLLRPISESCANINHGVHTHLWIIANVRNISGCLATSNWSKMAFSKLNLRGCFSSLYCCILSVNNAWYNAGGPNLYRAYSAHI